MGNLRELEINGPFEETFLIRGPLIWINGLASQRHSVPMRVAKIPVPGLCPPFLASQRWMQEGRSYGKRDFRGVGHRMVCQPDMTSWRRQWRRRISQIRDLDQSNRIAIRVG